LDGLAGLHGLAFLNRLDGSHGLGGGGAGLGRGDQRQPRRLRAATPQSFRQPQRRARAQDDAAGAASRLDPPRHLQRRDARQRGCVGRGRLGPEVAVVGGEVAEVLGDGPHGPEGVVEALERARERPVRDRQHLLGSDHGLARFLPVPPPAIPRNGGDKRTDARLKRASS
jgi:hypothetical protein